jgi:hypothetical protein
MKHYQTNKCLAKAIPENNPDEKFDIIRLTIKKTTPRRSFKSRGDPD